MQTELSPQEQAVREELKATLAEIEAKIEAELAKLIPLIGEQSAAILAIELEVNPSRLRQALPAEATRVH